MLQTWSTILAMSAVLLPLASNAGTATLQIQDADRNVEAVFLGWDNVILINDAITQMVRAGACNNAVYPECDSSDLDNVYILSQVFSAYLGYGVISVDDLWASVGSEERFYAVIETLDKLREATSVYFVVTSVYPFTAEQMLDYTNMFTTMVGLEGAPIIALADPGDGTIADKGPEIQKVMDNIGVQFDEAIFVDTSENIDAATKVCNTLSLAAGGLSDTDRLYLEMLATFPLPLGEVPTTTICPETTTTICPETTTTICPETTCPETTCPPEVDTTEAPTGIVYADKACGSRTYIGKAHDPVLCSEMVVDDARCTNKDYFMYRAANAACNCVGAADDCYSDLHTVTGCHIYRMSFFGQA